MANEATRVAVSTRVRKILERLKRAKKTKQELAERVNVVLMSAGGIKNLQQATKLDVDQRVRRWRRRWSEGQKSLADAEREGAPIATGIIEGACRHLINDRLEHSGNRLQGH